MSEKTKSSYQAASLYRERKKHGKEEIFEKDLINGRKDFLPLIGMAMNKENISQTSLNKDVAENDVRPMKWDRRPDSERNLLRDKLQQKLGELIDEQQALLNLYFKAARAAKDKEEEYRERIAELIEQSEKDKQLMDLFRNI